jgi:hypothetical protein
MLRDRKTTKEYYNGFSCTWFHPDFFVVRGKEGDLFWNLNRNSFSRIPRIETLFPLHA